MKCPACAAEQEAWARLVDKLHEAGGPDYVIVDAAPRGLTVETALMRSDSGELKRYPILPRQVAILGTPA